VRNKINKRKLRNVNCPLCRTRLMDAFNIEVSNDFIDNRLADIFIKCGKCKKNIGLTLNK